MYKNVVIFLTYTDVRIAAHFNRWTVVLSHGDTLDTGRIRALSEPDPAQKISRSPSPMRHVFAPSLNGGALRTQLPGDVPSRNDPV